MFTITCEVTDENGEKFTYEEVTDDSLEEWAVILIGKGMAFEHDWIPGSVSLCISLYSEELKENVVEYRFPSIDTLEE